MCGASGERTAPPPVLVARLPPESPTWSLMLSRLGVTVAAGIIVLAPPTAAPELGKCAFIVVVVGDVDIPCCLMDWSRCSMMAARRLWPPRSVDRAAGRCTSFDAELLKEAASAPFTSGVSTAAPPEAKFFLLASHFTVNRSIDPCILSEPLESFGDSPMRFNPDADFDAVPETEESTGIL